VDKDISVEVTIGLRCPFCREDSFDHIGLKTHLMVDCDAFEQTELGNTFRFETTRDRSRAATDK
jgi:hypothetical protein